MINTVELEKRWTRYKTRTFSSLFFVLFFVLTIPYLSYYLFQQYNLIVKQEKDKNISKIITHDEQLTVKDELASTVETNLIKEVHTSKNINKNSNDVVLAPSIPIVDFNNERRIDREIEQKRVKQKREKENKIEKSRATKERAYRKKVAKRRALEKKRAQNLAKKRNLIKAKSSLAFSSSESNVAKGNNTKKRSSSNAEQETKKINFKTTSSNYMRIMKKKFEQNKNPREAILIAKAYYKAGNYVESEKWALAANDLDKKSEESWFLFAKSKSKLGKRREALKILVSYYKKTKSVEAKELIEQIKSGSL